MIWTKKNPFKVILSLKNVKEVTVSGYVSVESKLKSNASIKQLFSVVTVGVEKRWGDGGECVFYLVDGSYMSLGKWKSPQEGSDLWLESGSIVNWFQDIRTTKVALL